MADTTDEENLNTPTDNQAENFLNEITPINYTENSNSNQETKNMEVHHHAHDPAAPHHKKNWKSYFWEFLMLFLAVFCGFFAEYQLEHKIERDRASELAESFYAELKVDSAAVKSAILFIETKDSALHYLKHYLKDSTITTVSKEFSINYGLGLTVNTPAIFEPRAAILDQLINSGSLRYFKSKESQKLTIDLSIAIQELKSRNERIRLFIAKDLDPFTIQHSDDEWLDKILELGGFYEYQKSNIIIPFHFYNPEKVDKVADINRLGIFSLLLKQNAIFFYKRYDSLNKKLLINLRKEYRLH
ncbi:hypothetical protein MCEGE10_02560 [Flavobacteriaceae bacterium]